MPSKPILIIQKKPSGPAGFNGGTTVSISLIPEGFMAKIHFTIFYDFSETVFFHKPLRDERYGDGSATVETGRSVRFFSVLLISILKVCSPSFC